MTSGIDPAASSSQLHIPASSALASDAVAQLCARYADIAGDWEGPQPDRWELMLRDALAAPDFQPLAARDAFEAQVVAVLADGWQPGHDALFWVAPKLFGWTVAPERLERFGAAGARLRQALDEQRRFDHQVDRIRFLQRYIAGRLRQPSVPDDDELLYRVPHAVDMARRFPTWSAIVTDLPALERWTARYCTLPKARALPAPGDTRPWSPDVESNRALAWIVAGTVVLLAVIAVVSRLGEARGPRPRAQMSFVNSEPMTPADSAPAQKKD